MAGMCDVAHVSAVRSAPVALPPVHRPPRDHRSPQDHPPLPGAHAHGDGEHERPLYDALSHGFTSVEADVWLVGGRLLVAHDRGDVYSAGTLRRLYLDPLERLAAANGGVVLPGRPCDAGRTWPGGFQLLVDMKSDAEAGYAALHELLGRYRHLVTCWSTGDPRSAATAVPPRPGAVTVVVSGNRTLQTMAGQPVRYAGYDGRVGDLAGGLSAQLMPLVSDDWREHFDWRGRGPMPPAEARALRALVRDAHRGGHRLRFWATADKPGPARTAMWRELLDAGVDYLNSDDLSGLRDFLSAPR